MYSIEEYNKEELAIQIIIFVFAFFSIFYFIKNWIKKGYIRQITALFISWILTPIIFWILSIGYYFVMTKEAEISFDKSLWKENVEIRYRMINSLQKDYDLEGRPINEVFDLLGQPYKGDSATYLIYNLGTSKYNVSFKENFLHIYIHNGNVSDLKTYEYGD